MTGKEILAAINALIDSEDDTGCSEDLTVVNAKAMDKIIDIFKGPMDTVTLIALDRLADSRDTVTLELTTAEAWAIIRVVGEASEQIPGFISLQDTEPLNSAMTRLLKISQERIDRKQSKTTANRNK